MKARCESRFPQVESFVTFAKVDRARDDMVRLSSCTHVKLGSGQVVIGTRQSIGRIPC